jgi:hypothetical protein
MFQLFTYSLTQPYDAIVPIYERELNFLLDTSASVQNLSHCGSVHIVITKMMGKLTPLN